MSDEAVLGLERSFEQDPCVENEVALLKERLRLGAISRDELALAAALGHAPAAALAAPWAPPAIDAVEGAVEGDAELSRWLARAVELDPLLLLRVACGWARQSEPTWRERADDFAPFLGQSVARGREDADWTPTLEREEVERVLVAPWLVVEEWAAEPSPEREASVRQLHRLYSRFDLEDDALHELLSIGRRVCRLAEQCAELREGRPDSPEQALLNAIFGLGGGEQERTPEVIASERRADLVRDLGELARDVASCLGAELPELDRAARALAASVLCGHAPRAPEAHPPLFRREQLQLAEVAIVEGPHELTVTVPARAFDPSGYPVADDALEGFPEAEVEGLGRLSDHLEGLDTVLFGGTLAYGWDGGLRARFRFLVNRTLWPAEERRLRDQLSGQITDGAGENPLDVTWNGVAYAIQACTGPMELECRPAPEADVPTPSPLFGLIEADDLAGLRAAVEGGASVADARDRFGRTPLFFALTQGRLEIVEHLLALEPTPVAQQDAFVFAASYEPVAARRFLAHGVEVERRDQHGRTALNAAVASGDVDLVRALLEAGADPNREDLGSGSGWRPLHQLSHVRADVDPQLRVQLARVLLDAGADPTLTNAAGERPPLPLDVGFLHWGERSDDPVRETPEGLRAALDAGALAQANLELAALLGHPAAQEVTGERAAADLAATSKALASRWALGPAPVHPAELLAEPFGEHMHAPLTLRAVAAIARVVLRHEVEDSTLRATRQARFDRAARQGSAAGIYSSPDEFYDELFSVPRESMQYTLLGALRPDTQLVWDLPAATDQLPDALAAPALAGIRSELIPWALGMEPLD